MIILLLFSIKSWACYFDFTQKLIDCRQQNYQEISVFAIPPFDLRDPAQGFVACMNVPNCETCINFAVPRSIYLKCPNGQTPNVAKSVDIFPDKSAVACGSIINLDNQILSESIKIQGTPFSLNYSSDKVSGRKSWYKAAIPITGAGFNSNYGPSGFKRIDLKINIADKEEVFQLNPSSSNEVYYYNWDGKNSLGENIKGSHVLLSVVDYIYDVVIAGKQDQTLFPLGRGSNLIVGNPFYHDYGLGGWQIENHHIYDKTRKTLFKGDGSVYKVSFSERANGDVWVVDDNSNELYIFDQYLKHKQTLNSIVGNELINFQYDSSGHIVAVVDKYNNMTALNYTNSRLSSIVAPNGFTTKIQTDVNGYIKKITNPLGQAHEMTYDSNGLLLTFLSPNGINLKSYTYDSDGMFLNETDNLGTVWGISKSVTDTGRTIYQNSGMQRTDTHAISSSNEQFTRTSTYTSGLIKNYVEIPSSGITTQSADDGNYSLRIQKTTNSRFGSYAKRISNIKITSGGQLANYNFSESYNLFDHTNPMSVIDITTVTEKDSKQTETKYIKDQNVFTETSPMGKIKKTYLNDKGDIASVENYDLGKIEFLYNPKGLLTRVKQGGRITNFGYNARDQLKLVRNALDQETFFSFDRSNRLIKMTFPGGRFITYSYDLDGNLLTITPPSRPSHDFQYDDRGDITEYIPPLLALPGTSTTYTYNLDRQVSSITRPGVLNINFNYAPGSENLTSINLPTGNRNFSYFRGNLNSSSSEDFVSRSQNISGTRIRNQSLNRGPLTMSLAQTYNTDLNPSAENLTVKSITQPTVNYTYDNDDLLIGVGSENFQRNTINGLLNKISHGLINTDLAYTSRFGELRGISTYTNSTTLIYRELLTRDLLGRIITKAEKYPGVPRRDYTYNYDDSGRLVSVFENSNLVSTYTYDSNGNRITSTKNSVVTDYTVDDQDRLISAGSKSFNYNLNGDLSSVSESGVLIAQYNYDVFSNLKSVILPSKTITYQVDAHNNRITKIVDGTIDQFYLWTLDRRLIGVANSSGNLLSRFVYGSKSHVPDYMELGSDKYQIITDHLGSPVLVVNVATGVVVQEVKYDEFGNILSDSNPGFTPFGFAGCLYDQDTKLCRFGARDYDASIGRWLSKDPILFDGGDTNLYGYVMQDPVNFIDPTGEVLIAPIIGGVLVGGGFDLAAQLIQSGGNFNNVSWASVAKSAAIGGALGGFGRLLGPFTTRGLPGGIQRARKYIRFDRPHHGKGYGFDGIIGKHLNTPAKLSPLLGLEGDDRSVCE